MAKLYEIENFREKIVIFEGVPMRHMPNGEWHTLADALDYTDVVGANFFKDGWTEYIEPKPKKKYTMYRHWYLDLTGILCQCCTNRSWEDFSYTCNGGTLLETEIVKEFEV